MLATMMICSEKEESSFKCCALLPLLGFVGLMVRRRFYNTDLHHLSLSIWMDRWR
jgi:hypothetical protein